MPPLKVYQFISNNFLLIFELTHCILNRLSHAIYWKSPISILGTSSYEIYMRKMAKLFANSGDWSDPVHLVLRHLIWVCKICQLPFYGYPDYNGLRKELSIISEEIQPANRQQQAK